MSLTGRRFRALHKCVRKPGYLDPKEGRGWLVITSQNFHLEEDGRIRMPGFLREIHIKTGQKAVRQIRVRTDGNAIRILLVYEKEECTAASSRGTAVMGIDLGVDNLITAVWNTEQPPVILSGCKRGLSDHEGRRSYSTGIESP